MLGWDIKDLRRIGKGISLLHTLYLQLDRCIKSDFRHVVTLPSICSLISAEDFGPLWKVFCVTIP